MKKILCIIFSTAFLLVQAFEVEAAGVHCTQNDIKARAAILMESHTGRILFSKNSSQRMPNASTTKILTCLLVLEKCHANEKVHISKYAASQPKVRLGVRAGEVYHMKDLLYAMMLESYNDCAVALAEHTGGSVKKFSEMMNEKAKQLGAFHSNFISPNGLDASDKNGFHGTTAKDLAIIMKACINNDSFLNITRKKSYRFQDVSGRRSFSCVNHNALLFSMKGAVSGKTGYTSKAGYCYVGAVRKNKMTLIAVLLSCGWPPHKTYKWADMTRLVSYGADCYFYQIIRPDFTMIKEISVRNGKNQKVKIVPSCNQFRCFMKKGEKPRILLRLPEYLEAPVRKNETVGVVVLQVDGKTKGNISIRAQTESDAVTYSWYLKKLFRSFILL